MGNFSNNAITDVGKMLLADVQAGAVFTPTRIVMGSGSMPGGATAQGMTDVITPVAFLAINKKKRTPDGKCIFGGVYTNEQVTEPFYFRELALYAKGIYHNEDGSVKFETPEVLYSYGNAGATADYMPAYSTSTVVEKQMDLVVWVGNDAQVDLTIKSGVYVTHELFNIHAARHAIGGDDPLTPADIGAVNKAGDTMEGRLWLGNGTYNGYGSLASNESQVHLCIHANSNDVEKNIRYIGLISENDTTQPDLKDAVFLGSRDETLGTNIYRLYGEHNKPTPADIGAVNKAGDTMAGNLEITKQTAPTMLLTETDTGSGVHIQLWKNKVFIANRPTAGEGSNYRSFYISNHKDQDNVAYALGLSDVRNGVANYYTVLHTGNLSTFGLAAVPASVE